MKACLRSLAVLVLVHVSVSSVAAGVPAFVTWSGRLTDGTGWGQSDEVNLMFRLYDCGCPSDGDCASPCADGDDAPLWIGLHMDTMVVDGYFTVNLGMCNDLGACDPNPANASFPDNLPEQIWIGVVVGGVELSPRQPVGSVPYAVAATSAESAGTAALAGNANALGGVSATSWNTRRETMTAIALCRSVTGNSTGSAYPIPTGAASSALAVCQGNGSQCHGRVNAGFTSNESGKWSSDLAAGCSSPVGSNTGWYACCSY